MAFCPNINSQEVKQVFNGIVTMFEGAPLTDAEFKSVEERAKRTGTDKEAMDIAYYTWDKFKGENIPETKEEILQSIVEESYIKPGVSELFESNPELAKAVYEAFGFKTTIDNPVYSAVFFNTDKVTSKYKQVHPNLYSHHSTIQFKPSDISNLPIGDIRNIKIVGRLTTDKVDVLIVENPLSTNKFPHITLSTAEGIKPFESNSEIEKNQSRIQPIDDTIQGTVGVFDGKSEITSPTLTSQQKQQAQQLYSQYLDTIFPDSKVKDIVYHGTNKEFDTDIEGFKKFVQDKDNVIENNQITKNENFDRIERLSNLLINKLDIKTRRYVPRKNGIPESAYSTVNYFMFEIAKEAIEKITGFELAYDKEFTLNSLLSAIQEIDFKHYWTQRIERLENINLDNEVEKLKSDKRLLLGFLGKDREDISGYTEEQQEVIKKGLPKLFEENAFKSKEHGKVYYSKVIEFTYAKKLEKAYKRIAESKLHIEASKKRFDTLLALDEFVPDYKERIASKVISEIERRLWQYDLEEVKSVRDFREKELAASFLKQQSILSNSQEIKNAQAYFNYEKEGIFYGDSVSILKKIIKENSKFSPLASTLLKFARIHNVKVIGLRDNDMEGLAGSYTAELGQLPENGATYIKKDSIRINIDSDNTKVPQQLLLHEILHSLTTIYVNDRVHNKKGEDSITQFREYVYQQIIKQGKFKSMFYGIGAPYGLNNNDEFVVEALTNPEFAHLLKSIPPLSKEKYLSLFEELLEFIVDLFSGLKNHNNVHEQIVDFVDGILKAQSEFSLYKEQVVNNLRTEKTYTFPELLSMLPTADDFTENETTAQTEDYPFKEPPYEELKQVEEKVLEWLKRVNVKIKAVPVIRDSEGNELTQVAKAAMLQRIIEVVEEKRDITTLPEEAGHFLVEILGEDNPLVQKMMRDIEKYDIYQDVIAEYSDIYNNDEQLLRKEAVGKLIALLFVEKATGINAGISEKQSVVKEAKNWFERIWEIVKRKLSALSSREVEDTLKPFREAAEMIYNNESIDSSKPLKDIVLYQADVAKNEVSQAEVINAIKNIKLVYDPGIKGYRAEDGRIVRYRVTDAVKRFYLRIFGDPGKEENETVRLAAEKGTYIHALLRVITKKRIAKANFSKQSIVDEVINALKVENPEIFQRGRSFFNLTDEQFSTLVAGIDGLLAQIDARTAIINKHMGLSGKSEIFNELTVYNKEKDEAGTIDLAVVYPNGSIAVFDFKGINFHEYKGVVEKEIPNYKITAYDMQIAGYKAALVSMLGKQTGVHFAETRIIPINLQFHKENPEIGFRKIEMGTVASHNKNEYLDQITVSEEYTLSKRVNQTLKRFYELRKNIEKKLRSGPNDFYSLQLKKINDHINDIIIRKEFAFAYEDLNALLASVNNRIHAKPDDKNYLTDDELLFLLDYVKIYDQFTVNVGKHIMAPKTKAGQENLDKFKKAASIRDELRHTLAMIQFDRINSSDDIDITAPGKPAGAWGRLFTSLSRINHPIFQKLAKMVQRISYLVGEEIEQDEAVIDKAHEELVKWAKSKGMTVNDAFNKIVNKKTGNLISKLNKGFYNERAEARKEQNLNWFLENTEVRVNNNKNQLEYTGEAKKLFEERKKNYAEMLKVWYPGDTNEGRRKKLYKNWIAKYDISSNEGALYNAGNYFIKLNESSAAASRHYNPDWVELQKPENAPLKAYYDMYIDFNKKFSELTGNKIDSTFIANIKKDLIDGIGESGIGSIKNLKNYFFEALSIQQHDELLGVIDPETGKRVPSIPHFYSSQIMSDLTEKEKAAVYERVKEEMKAQLKENFSENLPEFTAAYEKALWNESRMKGLSMKSFDLTRSLKMFSIASRTYHHQKQTEATAIGLLNFSKSGEAKVYYLDKKGRAVNDPTGQGLKVLEGLPAEDQKAFERFVNMYWYGHNMGETSLSFNVKGRDISGEKLARMVMQGVSVSLLALKPTLAISQAINSKGNSYIFASEGVYFNTKQLNKAQAMALSKDKMYKALVEHFKIREVENRNRRSLKSSATATVRNLNLETAFFMHRKGDEIVDDNLLVSMVQNYGLDEAGNVKRLSKLPKGTKSLLELAELDSNGKLTIKGMSKDAFYDFRTRVIGVARSVKGNMLESDKSLISSYFAGRLLMQMKTFILEAGKQRFGDTQVDLMTQELIMGRFRVFFGEVTSKNNSLVGEVLKLIGELIFIYNRKLDPQTTEMYFNLFKEQNPQYSDMKIEEYAEMRLAKFKGMVTELRIYLTMILLALFAKSIIPEKEKVESADALSGANMERKAAIYFYRVVNRTLLEFSFWFSPYSVQSLIRFPVASFGILTDLLNIIANGGDEIRDLILGENSKNDKTDMFYYTSKRIPFINSVLEIAGYYNEGARRVNA